MIPDFVDIGSDWEVLPPGIHVAPIADIESRFATNAKRRILFNGFILGLESLIRAGSQSIYLDGSFISQKPHPGDFDACWDPIGVDDTALDPVLLEFSNKRAAQKLKYGGEFFPSSFDAVKGSTFLEYFQIDKVTGHAKGILRVQIQSQAEESKS